MTRKESSAEKPEPPLGDTSEGLTCEICGLAQGDTSDGLEPLGPMETCDLCGKRVCPLCISEADCCFADADDHEEDPTWSPKGWRRVPSKTDGMIIWERESSSKPSNAADH